MQTMEKESIEINQMPLRVYRNIPEKNYTRSDLEAIAIDFWYKNLSAFNNKPRFQVCFIFRDEIEKITAIADFEYGKLIDIQQQANKFGIAGKKVTMNIGIVSKHHVIKALDCHFGRTKFSESFKSPDINLREEFPSAFKRNMDLLYEVTRVTDGMNLSGKEENSLGAGGPDSKSDKNFGGNYSETISNNMLLRTLTKEDDNQFIPYHSFFITHETIEEAFNTLALKPFSQLWLWYFTEERIPKHFDKHDKKIISQEMEEWGWLKRSSIGSEYMRAWREKQKALNDLRHRIISVLLNKDAFG